MLKIQETVNAFCSHPFRRIKISAEGDATMCCFQHRKCLGNLLELSLEDLWHGKVAQAVREETLAGRLHPACLTKSCPLVHLKDRPTQEVLHFAYPREFEIDLPNQHCNIGGEEPTEEHPACLMCERHLFYVKQEDRLNEVCQKLQPYIHYVNHVHIQGVAEPFWKDRIFEIIDNLGIEPHKNQIMVTTTTNGTIFTQARQERFLKYPNSSVTFSIDACTPETFKLIRRVDMYDKIVENLMAYASQRREGQHLRIHNNINLLNLHEVVGMVELAAKANCLVEFNPTYNAPMICVNESNVHLFQKAQDDILAAAKRLGVQVGFMRDFALDFGAKIESKVEVTSKDLALSAKRLGISRDRLESVLPPNQFSL